MRENIKKLYANMRKKPAVSMETYRIIQETYKAMTGQPMIKCRTEAFHNIMAQIPVFIEKGDILAGNGAACPNGLEIDYANGIWDRYEIEALKKDGYGFYGDEEELFKLNESVPPYGFSDGIAEVLSEDSFLMPFLRSGMALVKWEGLKHGRQTLQCGAQGGLNLTPAQSLVCLDYETALKTGLRAMIEDCDRKMAGMIFETAEEYDQYIYVKCMKRSLEGVCLYAGEWRIWREAWRPERPMRGGKGSFYRWSISAAGFRNIRPALSGKRFRCTGLFFLRWPALIQLLEWGAWISCFILIIKR